MGSGSGCGVGCGSAAGVGNGSGCGVGNGIAVGVGNGAGRGVGVGCGRGVATAGAREQNWPRGTELPSAHWNFGSGQNWPNSTVEPSRHWIGPSGAGTRRPSGGTSAVPAVSTASCRMAPSLEPLSLCGLPIPNVTSAVSRTAAQMTHARGSLMTFLTTQRKSSLTCSTLSLHSIYRARFQEGSGACAAVAGRRPCCCCIDSSDPPVSAPTPNARTARIWLRGGSSRPGSCRRRSTGRR